MKILLTFLLAFTLSSASVKIYKNKVELSYVPSSKFIGLNKNIIASNKDGDIKLIKSSCLNSTNSTCRAINTLNELSNSNKALNKEKKVMEKLLDNFYSDYKSAKTNLDYISQMSKSLAKVESKITQNNNEINQIKQSNYFHSFTPIYFDKLHKKEVKLNFNGISFYSKYILDIDKNKLQHSLHIKNSSGIDIQKTTAYIFERNYYATTPNTAFRSSKVSKTPKITKVKAQVRTLMYDSAPLALSSMAKTSYAPRLTKTSTRNYKISNFSLNSNNLEKKFVVDSKKVKVKKETIWRTWQNSAFVEGSFKILDALAKQKIDIVYNNSFTKNNTIRTKGNRVLFNIVQEYDVKVKRKNIPTYTQSKGIFNSDTMKKKTIQLQVTNLSSKSKKLTIYTKVPVSTNEDIKVKLEYFKDSKTNKNIQIKHNKKSGKITFSLELKPKEYKEFTYEYSIRHSKDINIFVRD